MCAASTAPRVAGYLRSLGVEMSALTLTPSRMFWASCVLIIGCSSALPFVGGYATNLFQTVVLGAWSIVASITSDAFADRHKVVVWLVAAALNVTLFSIPAVGVLVVTRGRWPIVGTVVLILWLLFYIASLFFLFPATDGP